jgi:hypothetical protein
MYVYWWMVMDSSKSKYFILGEYDRYQFLVMWKKKLSYVLSNKRRGVKSVGLLALFQASYPILQ